MTTLKIIGKWTILIWLNAAFSFFIAYTSKFDSLPEVLGLVCGVFTFVGLYSYLDFSLLKQNKQSLRNWLLIGVLIKAVTQFLPAIQIITGMIAVSSVDAIFDHLPKLDSHSSDGLSSLSRNDSFIATYLATVIDGILLSLIVGVFVLIIKLIATIVIPYLKTSQKIETNS